MCMVVRELAVGSSTFGMIASTWRAVLLTHCIAVSAVDFSHIGAAGIGGARPWMGSPGRSPVNRSIFRSTARRDRCE